MIHYLILLSLPFNTIIISSSFAQVIKQSSTFRSEVDASLTIDQLSVLPFSDNVEGIYARPLEAHLLEILNRQHRWEVVSSPTASSPRTPDELALDPKLALSIAQEQKGDAFFATRVTKGPNGISILINLFQTSTGQLLLTSERKGLQTFQVAGLKTELDKMFTEILAKIPYSGRVLSREGQRVTVNVGTRDGVQKDQVISIIQITSALRHPKFNFLVSTEKEILGSVRLMKVEDTLSFGVITTERAKGAIQKDSKIARLDFVTYPVPSSFSMQPTPEESLIQSAEGKATFGETPTAWVPQKGPSYGLVAARFGLSSFQRNIKLHGVGSLDGKNDFAPQVFLDGELWITSDFTIRAKLRQGIIAIDNQRPGSSPSELSQSLTQYELMFGYAIRFGPHPTSAYIEPSLGYMNSKLFVDDSSPQAFTTMEYAGFKLGLKGAFPITPNGDWVAGGELFMLINPGLNESPNSSGASSDNSINQFGVFGAKKLGERLRLQGHLDFELYSTSFKGTGTRAESATSASQRFTTLSFGIAYLF